MSDAQKTKALAALAAAAERYSETERAHEAARQDAVEKVLTALRAGCGPAEVARTSPFTPTYVRRLARAAEIPPAPTGMKPGQRKTVAIKGSRVPRMRP